MRNAYVCIGKPQRKNVLGKQKDTYGDNIRIVLE
jgi:hypothetical protein